MTKDFPYLLKNVKAGRSVTLYCSVSGLRNHRVNINFRLFLNKSQPYSLALELYHFLLNIFRQTLWHQQEFVLTLLKSIEWLFICVPFIRRILLSINVSSIKFTIFSILYLILLSVWLSGIWFIYLYDYLVYGLSICMSIWYMVYLSVCLLVYGLSICMSIWNMVYLSVWSGIWFIYLYDLVYGLSICMYGLFNYLYI